MEFAGVNWSSGPHFTNGVYMGINTDDDIVFSDGVSLIFTVTNPAELLANLHWAIDFQASLRKRGDN